MAIASALNNNQYLWNWFMTHCVIIGVKVQLTCSTIGHFCGLGILFYNAIGYCEEQRLIALLNSEHFLNRMTLDVHKCFQLTIKQTSMSISFSPLLWTLPFFLVQVIIFYIEHCASLMETSFIPTTLSNHEWHTNYNNILTLYGHNNQ